jgi:hypothetical protein
MMKGWLDKAVTWVNRSRMPLFRRPDGELVKNESLVRRMIPYLMKGRNESLIYHDQSVDLTRLRPWLRAYNRSHESPATLFHILLWAIAQGFHARPGLNRFISGGRIYQRKGVQLSFAAKKKMEDGAPLVTIKLPFPQEEKFSECLARIKGGIGEGRGGIMRTVDKEVALAMKLPGFLLRFVLATLRKIDQWNLLPGSMIANDPMYTTAFVANLGSVGIDNTYHHLYEYGTASFFCVIGVPKKVAVVGRDEKIEVKEQVQLRWAFDERINDGLACAFGMRYIQRLLEDPERYIGSPEEGATAPAEKPAEKPAEQPAAAAPPTPPANGTAKPGPTTKSETNPA